VSIQVGGKAPYAPFASINTIIDRHVKVGIPGRIDADMLERLGITEPLRPRTLAAVKLLDFCDDDGNLTPEFDNLKRVPTDEIPDRLGQMLKRTYAPVFEIVGDPAAAEAQVIDDAFKAFEPRGQIVRMIQLFTGLMVLANLMPEAKARRKPGPKTIKVPKSALPAGFKGTGPHSSPADPPVNPDPPADPPVQPRVVRPEGFGSTIDLGSEGTVTLYVDVNPIALSVSNREAFFTIVDAFNDWRSALTPDPHGGRGNHDSDEVSTP
jgi:hypothetical protein